MEMKVFVCTLFSLVAAVQSSFRFTIRRLPYRYDPFNPRFQYFQSFQRPFFVRSQRFQSTIDPREDCRDLTVLSKNFCSTSEKSNLFKYQRTVSGICNNLTPGKGAVGAADTQVARLARPFYIGTDVLVGDPTIPGHFRIFRNRDVQFRNRDVPSAQEVTDLLFRISFRDRGNRNRTSVIFMTFGQFLDHDFAYVIHGPTSLCPEQCEIENGAFDYPCNNVVEGPITSRMSSCVRFVRSFAACENSRGRRPREHPMNITHYVDGSMIYGSTDRELELLRDGKTALMKVKSTPVGDLLPDNPESDEPCQEIGGCFLAGDRRVNENTALATMHTVWVRLHNVYAKQITEEFKNDPSTFQSASKSTKEKDEIIFQEARKMVIATLQQIVYNEWLVKLKITLPEYKGYNPNVRAELSHAFITAAFRFGHTLVPNFFPQLNPDYTDAQDPLSVRESFNNNLPITTNGIEQVVRGLIGNQSENFDSTFSASIGKTLFIPPSEQGFQNLLALNIHRGRDHGLASYQEYRDICGIKAAKPYINDPFSIFRDEIKNRWTRERLEETYGSVSNHIDLFAAGIAESDSSKDLLGPTFKCIIRRAFTDLRDGDRFFFQNNDQFSIAQQKEVKKMTLAKVMCLTLENTEIIQENLFDAFNPKEQQRKNCFDLLKNSLNVTRWLRNSVYDL